jgi:ubiquinone/menaquinone biosynthesis C-methylase UbiE
MFIKAFAIRTAKGVLVRFPKKVVLFFKFFFEFFKLKSKADNRFKLRFSDVYPCLNDRVKSTPFDQHYIYHPAWAARVLAKTKPEHHIDISSILSFSSIVSAFVPITFYDYRPAELNLNNFNSKFADLKQLDFDNNSVSSISCMHTIEHIGLGRYGDELDFDGDIKAIKELVRVAKVGGDIIFVTPVGKPKIEFNAHRIYAFEQIVQYFEGCDLQEFSLIPDAGGLIENANPGLVAEQSYGCGCFWFKKII